jgi:hypothetical protein
VPVTSVIGKVQRIIIGRTRDGHSDRGRLWRPLLTTELHLPGVDLTALRAGIERCLRAGSAGGVMVSRP